MRPWPRRATAVAQQPRQFARRRDRPVNRHGSELPRPFSGGGFFSLLLALAALAGVSPAAADSFAWQVATPESQAMSGKKLDALKEDLAARRTRAFLVLRNDKVVCEW